MSNHKIKVIFIGTADFGRPSLRALSADPLFRIECVITQPDKNTGRRQVLTPTPIKTEAQKIGLAVLQPVRIVDVLPDIAKIKPDLIIVAAYAQILPEKILAIPRFGCLNIHASLLPKCRGAACIQGAILNGDGKTGITVMKMDKGLDTGPILAQSSVRIGKSDNTGILSDKLSVLGARVLIPTLKKYIAGNITPIRQNENKSSYFKILKKQDGHINWLNSAAGIERFIRAMNPWPGAFGYLQVADKIMLKIIDVDSRPKKINRHQPGTIFVDNKELLVQCGQDSLAINKLQLSGKNVISANDFIRGHNSYIGNILN